MKILKILEDHKEPVYLDTLFGTVNHTYWNYLYFAYTSSDHWSGTGGYPSQSSITPEEFINKFTIRTYRDFKYPQRFRKIFVGGNRNTHKLTIGAEDANKTKGVIDAKD